MSKKKICAGLIGAGRIGKMHAENIRSRIPNVDLHTVADLKPDKSWAKELRISTIVNSAEELLADPDIEAVVIATPSDTHVEMICKAAESGKNIFCEKPVAFDPHDILRAINTAKENQVMLQVGFNRRFDPDFLSIKNAINNGQIGKPHIIKITNRDPKRPDPKFIPDSGGLFMDFCIHDFDAIRFLCDSEIEEVFVMGAVLVDPLIGELGDIDTALLTLKLENGALAVIDVSRETSYGYDQQVEVFGNKGSIRAPNTRPTQTFLSTTAGVYHDKPHYSFIERYAEAYVRELETFFSNVQNDISPSVTGEDALRAVRIALAAQDSYRVNEPVKVQS
ncbi:MAG: inositol 2-dehydrogenase [Candidatus Neomarinimicrobiota bacterium]